MSEFEMPDAGDFLNAEAEPRLFGLSDRVLVVLGLSLLMSLSILFRYLYLLRSASGVSSDATRYVMLAQAFIAGDWVNAISFHYYPLYPILISPFLSLVERPEDAARWTAIIFSSLTVIPIFLLVRFVMDKRVAWVAVILFTFKAPNQAVMGHAAVIMNFFIYSALFLSVRSYYKKSWPGFLVSGALFGLGFLCKAEALGYFGWLIILIAGYGIWDRLSWKKLFLAFVPYILGYLVIVLPFLTYYTLITGHISINPKARSLFLLHNADEYQQFLSSVQEDKKGFYTNAQRMYMEGDRETIKGSVIQFLKSDRKRIFGDYFDRLFMVFRYIPERYFYLLLPTLGGLFFVLGFIRKGWTIEQARKESFIYWFGLCPLLLVPLFNPYYRFFIGLVPVLIICIARGIYQSLVWFDFFCKRWLRPLPHGLFISALLVLSILAVGPDIRRLMIIKPNHAYWEEIETKQEVANWIVDHLPQGCNFMASLTNMPIGYLGGLPAQRQILTPMEDIDKTIKYAKARQAKYIVLSSEELVRVQPNLLVTMFHSWFQHTRLERVHQIQSNLGTRYIVYEVKDVKCGE